VKKTCAQRATLTIIGFALDDSKWDGLFVGRRKGGAVAVDLTSRPLQRRR
jgi:hypothetical protein